ncbi:MAG: hypothetical protein ACW963_09875 [Candidatus Sifarchaeia archaeon]
MSELTFKDFQKLDIRIGELPQAKAMRLPASTIRLDPPLRGYGGLDVHRREFPTHHRYSVTVLLTYYINPTQFITPLKR